MIKGKKIKVNNHVILHNYNEEFLTKLEENDINNETFFVTARYIKTVKNNNNNDFKYKMTIKIKLTLNKNDVDNKDKIIQKLNFEAQLQDNDPVNDSLAVLNYDIQEYNLINKNTYKRGINRIHKIMMRSSSFPFIDRNGLEYYNQPTKYKCVYDALIYKYGWPQDYLYKIFKQFIEINNLQNEELYINFNIDSGVSSEQLYYLATIKDFSLYALDWNNKLFLKHLSTNNNHKAFVYILQNEHLYLIDDKYEIKSISSKYADKKHQNTFYVSNLMSDIDNIKYENLITLPIFENIEIKNLHEYKNCNIFYTKHDLDEEHILIYQIFNKLIDKNLKVNDKKKIIYIYYKDLNIHLYSDINYYPNNKLDYKVIKSLCHDLDIKFQNQSITNMVKEMEDLFYGIKRIRLTKTEKQNDSEIKTKFFELMLMY